MQLIMDSINDIGAKLRGESRQQVENRDNSNREHVDSMDTVNIGQRKKLIVRNQSTESQIKLDTFNSNTSEKTRPVSLSSSLQCTPGEPANLLRANTKLHHELKSTHADAISKNTHTESSAELRPSPVRNVTVSRVLSGAGMNKHLHFGKSFSGYGQTQTEYQFQMPAHSTSNSYPTNSHQHTQEYATGGNVIEAGT